MPASGRFSAWFIDELARHGYKLSPGTLYPLLHSLEPKGYLRSTTERSERVHAEAIAQFLWDVKY